MHTVTSMVVVIGIGSLLLVGGPAAAGAQPIPVTAAPDHALPVDVRAVVTGAPADSVMVRVSLCYRDGDGRLDAQSYLVIEEWRWPLPAPAYRIDMVGEPGASAAPAGDQTPAPAPVVVSRIPGGFLDQARRAAPLSAMPPPRATDAPRPRAGEIGGHLLRPFRFVAWLGPHRFAVDDGRAQFTIARAGAGRFELVSVERWE